MPYYLDMIKSKVWHVYVVAEQEDDGSYSGYFKIGSALSVERRVGGLKTSNPRKLVTVWSKDYGSRELARAVEKQAHKNCANRVPKTEWFKTTLVDAVSAIEQAAAFVTSKAYKPGPNYRVTW
jgi:hypothetical protein